MTKVITLAMLPAYIARIRIDVGNPIGAIIIAIVVTLALTGIVYLALSTIIEKIILPIMGVPREKRDEHILSKIAMIIAFIVLLVGVVIVVLPAFSIDTGLPALWD